MDRERGTAGTGASVDVGLRALALDRVANGVFITDADGRILWVNEAFSRMSGWAADEVRGNTPRMLMSGAHDREYYRRLWDTILQGRVWTGEVVERHRDGHHYRVWQTITPIVQDGVVTNFVAVHEDVTEHRDSQTQVRFQAELLEAVGDAVVATDLSGRIRYANAAARDLYGWGDRDVVGVSIDTLNVPPGSREQLDEVLARIEDGRTWSGEFTVHRGDGSTLTASVTLAPFADEAAGTSGLIGVSRDITPLVTMQSQLELAATHDALTGLPNRTLLLDRVEQVRAAAGRTGEAFAVAHLGLDGFSYVNHSLGTDRGDVLLQLLAARVRSVLSPYDTLARVGGDEFVLLLADCGMADAEAITSRVQAVLQEGVELDGAPVALTASIGLVPGGEYTDAERLLGDAEAAMRAAKRAGRNRAEVFAPSMRTRSQRRFELLGLMHSALEQQAIVVHYQPIVELATGHIIGAEALARLRDDDGQLISPAEFIPVAEDTGIIDQLGLQVLRQAREQAARWWAGQPGMCVQVNVSPRQLSNPAFGDHVREVLDATGPGSVCLEITETALLSSPRALATMRWLRSLGVHLAIDDFGTGYSSLAHLRQLPIDVLKIDRSFVSGVSSDVTDRALVQATIDMARAFGLTVTAEGVETAEQAAELHDLGAHHGQGYLWSRPVDADGFTRLLAQPPGSPAAARRA